MCIAIYKPGKELFWDSIGGLEGHHKSNPDGCGFMYAADGRINIEKGHYSYTEFLGLYNYHFLMFPGDFIFHFRTASSSDTTDQMCHPFFVDDNLAFVHNGNLFEFMTFFREGFNDNKSDTVRFNEQILQRLPKGFLFVEEIRSVLEKYCKENLSKMIFLDSSGHVEIINSQAGMWENGAWYSNGGINNYCGYGYSGAYYYSQGDIRHKGGLMTNKIFNPEIQKNWEQCKHCKGFYRQLKQECCSGCQTFETLKAFTS